MVHKHREILNNRNAIFSSLNRMWRHFSLDDAYTKISGVFCPAPGRKLKKNSRFMSTGNGILPSCDCKACETMVAKCELILWRTSPVDQIRLIGPLKPYLAEIISLQSSDCNILGLAATVAFFANEPIFLRFRHVLSKTKSVTPHFFTFLTSLNHYLSMVKLSEKKSMLDNFRANVLKG